jgi:hypothetical protein
VPNWEESRNVPTSVSKGEAASRCARAPQRRIGKAPGVHVHPQEVWAVAVAAAVEAGAHRLAVKSLGRVFHAREELETLSETCFYEERGTEIPLDSTPPAWMRPARPMCVCGGGFKVTLTLISDYYHIWTYVL